MNLAKIDNAHFLFTSSNRAWPVQCVDFDFKHQTDNAFSCFSLEVKNWQQAVNYLETRQMTLMGKYLWLFPKKYKTN